MTIEPLARKTDQPVSKPFPLPFQPGKHGIVNPFTVDPKTLTEVGLTLANPSLILPGTRDRRVRLTSPSILVLRMVFQGLHGGLPIRQSSSACHWILLPDLMRRLGLKLSEARQSARIQFALFHRLENRAARFFLVSAIAEPTTLRKTLNVRKDLLETLLQPSDPKLSHARRIEKKSSARNPKQLSTGCRVSPFPVPCPHFRGRGHRRFCKQVDECRLSDS